MTNEEKAKEISYGQAAETDYISSAAYNGAIEMAEWKDKQFENLLLELMICAQQGYTQCASDEVTINKMKQILKR